MAAGPPPALPLTQLDERQPAPDLDNHTANVTAAAPSPIRDLLALVVRGTGLSIVIDPAVAGTFVGELKNVTIRRALDTVLPPFGLDYAVDGTVIHVFRRQPETRFFDLNYNVASRVGSARVGGESGVSDVHVTTTVSTDAFAEIGAAVRALLSEGATYSVDRKAGLLQATDAPEHLDRVAAYLDVVHDRVHRQIEIDARVVQFEPNEPGGRRPLAANARIADVTAFLASLAGQGTVTTIAEPRLLTLNNETAIVRAADTSASGSAASMSVTISVTPQAADDGVITLSLSPLVRIGGDAGGDGRVPAILREADTLARVTDGETIVISLFGRERVELMVLLTPHVIHGS